MVQTEKTQTAGTLAFDIIRNGFHKPLIEGRSNRDNIESHIVIGILSGELNYYVDQEIVDLAISVVDDLIEEH